MISFDSIPGGSQLRVPGIYIEFNARGMGRTGVLFRCLVVGQKLAAGQTPAGTLVRVSRVDQARQYFGRGSHLANMLERVLPLVGLVEVHAIALDDLPAATAETWTIDVSGTASADGILNAVLGGTWSITLGQSVGDTASAIASGLVSAVNANQDQPFIAEVDGTVNTRVRFTAKNKGAVGNMDVSLYSTCAAPAAPVFTVTRTQQGQGNPDIAPMIAAMGETQYQWIINPYTDSANLNLLEAELLDRWGPMRQIDGRNLCAYRSDLDGALAFGSSRNSLSVACLAALETPQPAWMWTAVLGAVSARELSNDPSLHLGTVALPGLVPPPVQQRATRAEQNQLLWHGMSTYTVDDAGMVRVQRLVTMYQRNDTNDPDSAWLDITSPETMSRIRSEQRARTAAAFSRCKVDRTSAAPAEPGSRIVTIADIRAHFLGMYRDFCAKGWCRDYEGYAADLLIEFDDTDPTRVNVLDRPRLMSGLMVTAVHSEPKLL